MSKSIQNPGTANASSKSISRMAAYTPVLIAVLLMLPRLISAQFGLFDDGRILVTANTISHGTWYTGADSLEGRFRPIHWLWFTLSYLVGGKNPFWFYIANTLALAIIVAGLILLVHANGGSPFQAWMAGMAFVLAGPVIESFFTLKGEVLQATLMVLSLLSILPYSHAKTRLGKTGVLALTTVMLLLANLTKETTIVLIPISLAWYLLARFWPRQGMSTAKRATHGAYLLANLIAGGIFYLLRTIVLSPQILAGTYSGQYSFQIKQIAVSVLRWAGWLVRDFMWIVPLIAVAIILWILRRRLAGGFLLLEAILWMGAWICIYLPWNFMSEYYMLPFALAAAVFASQLIIELAAAFREVGWKSWMAIGGASLALLLLAGNLFNNLTNARVQLAVDSTNAAMMAYLVKHTAPGSTVLINIQTQNEYVVEMETQLGNVYDRPDLKISLFRSGSSPDQNAAGIYIVDPFVKNQPLLTVRMGVIEDTQNMWNDNLQGYLQTHPGWQIVYSPSDSFKLSDINYPRLFCPFVKTRAFCATPVPSVDLREFSYGWTIYKYANP